MATIEDIFNASVLEVVVPDTSLDFPPKSLEDWLAHVTSGGVERKQAFFDEQLQFFLTVRIDAEPPLDSDPASPPSELVQFLSRLQVAFEATYIPSVPGPSLDAAANLTSAALVSAPPRTVSYGQAKSKLGALPFPPNTPNPTPAAAAHDRRYIQSEGTLLQAGIWGQSKPDQAPDGFALSWVEKEQAWVVAYRLTVTVAFLRLSFPDPLLCLTVSATLREKSLPMTQKHPLVIALASKGHTLGDRSPSAPPEIRSHPPLSWKEGVAPLGLGEINLLEGLSAGPTFMGGAERPFLPSTRLVNSSRRQMFALGPPAVSTDMSRSSSPVRNRTPQPILRKSYRKTLQTVSGFRVRMRTVFVPFVFLHDDQGDEDEAEREIREAGNEEHTVVLCVEVENSGEAGPRVGFLVEGADVTIGGRGASAALIGRGESAPPLRVGATEQFNLLYAVSFSSSPHARTSGGDEQGPAVGDMQRAVTIDIHGKPFLDQTDPLKEVNSGEPSCSYPTGTFSSRWNCVLDLSSSQQRSVDQIPGSTDALPEPASPFPITHTPPSQSRPPTPPSATDKRLSVPAHLIASRAVGIGGTSSNRSSLRLSTIGPPIVNPRVPSKAMSLPPVLPLQPVPPSPTTYAAPPMMALSSGGGGYEWSSPSPSEGNTVVPSMDQQQFTVPPPTPAYPAYPTITTVPSASYTSYPQQGSIPASSMGSHVSSPMEIKRERGAGLGGSGMTLSPQTPGPMLTGTGPTVHAHAGEPIVISVGMSSKRKIYPLDVFTLDVFVFNRSSWTRRFELGILDERRRRKMLERKAVQAVEGNVTKGEGGKGMVPLDNRVRVGPLRPASCQSVRMDFLALVPGLHTVDALTLTDVESGVSVNLREVMDIVVYQR